MIRFGSPTAKLNSPRCRITDSVSPRSTSSSLTLFNEFNFRNQPTKRFYYHQRETIPTLMKPIASHWQMRTSVSKDASSPGPFGVCALLLSMLAHPPTSPYFHLCHMTEENMRSSNCRWEAGWAHSVCHMAESYNKNLWWRHCVLWHVSTCGGTKSSERERLNNMFVRQGANCSSLVSDQAPVGLKEIFTQHSTWTTGHGATTNCCCCQKNPNQPFKLFTAPKMPIPLQRKGLSWISLFLSLSLSRYWLFIQKASAPALSSPLSILQSSFYNLTRLKRCWRKASPQKSLLLLVKQKKN